MTDQKFKIALAKNLKSLRKEKQWSLDMASRKMGVSKAMLGQIERGESSPTVAVLWKIAKGFEVTFSELLANEEQVTAPTARTYDDQNIKIKVISPYQKDTGLEILELTLYDYYTQMNEGHSSGVIEYVVVIQGIFEVFSDGEWKKIKKRGVDKI